MTTARNTFFDRWASDRLGVSTDELSIAKLERLPVPTDLPEGLESEMGGETQSVLDTPTESELLELAELGEELLAEFPDLPDGYRPPPVEEYRPSAVEADPPAAEAGRSPAGS
jgi:hypothetical protein